MDENDWYGSEEFRDQQKRSEALQLAARTYGSEHPPGALVAAAEEFYTFLTGDYEV